MNNPKTHIVFDDARHYLMTTKNKYDIIASDPLDVFAKGTAALYSKEYFEAVKRAPESGRIVLAVRAAVRKRPADGAKRAGDVLRSVSECDRLGQHPQRRRATTWSSWARWSR